VLADSIIITLMMEAASTSETSVNFYQTTHRYNPEGSHLHTRHCKNLKSECARVFQLLQIRMLARRREQT
jgi:hypothetical protein